MATTTKRKKKETKEEKLQRMTIEEYNKEAATLGIKQGTKDRVEEERGGAGYDEYQNYLMDMVKTFSASLKGIAKAKFFIDTAVTTHNYNKPINSYTLRKECNLNSDATTTIMKDYAEQIAKHNERVKE